jgi:hypothetical protein
MYFGKICIIWIISLWSICCDVSQHTLVILIFFLYHVTLVGMP